MRRYETIAIIDSDLNEEQRSPVLDRVKDQISEMGGSIIELDEWGDRKLAYEIKKKERGYYVRFDYGGTPSLIDEIERFFRIDDRVLKYMTVLLDEDADIEAVKEELAKAAAQRALKAQEQEQQQQLKADSEAEDSLNSEPEPEPESESETVVTETDTTDKKEVE